MKRRGRIAFAFQPSPWIRRRPPQAIVSPTVTVRLRTPGVMGGLGDGWGGMYGPRTLDKVGKETRCVLSCAAHPEELGTRFVLGKGWQLAIMVGWQSSSIVAA